MDRWGREGEKERGEREQQLNYSYFLWFDWEQGVLFLIAGHMFLQVERITLGIKLFFIGRGYCSVYSIPPDLRVLPNTLYTHT